MFFFERLSSVTFCFVVLLVMLSGCSESDEKAQIDFYVTDSSAESAVILAKSAGAYESVVVALLRIELRGDGGTSVLRDFGNTPLVVDLMDLDSLGLLAVDDQSVSAGRYHQLRLIMDAPEETMGAPTNPESFLIATGDSTRHPIFVPSGGQSGMKVSLDPEVRIEPDLSYEIHLDFDSENSIRKTGINDRYIVRPTSVNATVTLVDSAGVQQP